MQYIVRPIKSVGFKFVTKKRPWEFILQSQRDALTGPIHNALKTFITYPIMHEVGDGI